MLQITPLRYVHVKPVNWTSVFICLRMCWCVCVCASACVHFGWWCGARKCWCTEQKSVLWAVRVRVWECLTVHQLWQYTTSYRWTSRRARANVYVKEGRKPRVCVFVCMLHTYGICTCARARVLCACIHVSMGVCVCVWEPCVCVWCTRGQTVSRKGRGKFHSPGKKGEKCEQFFF